MNIKFLKNKVLVLSLSFLSLFSFGSIAWCNNASASGTDRTSESVAEDPDGFHDQNNEDEIDNNADNEADDQGFDVPDEGVPEGNEQYSKDNEQPEDEKAELEDEKAEPEDEKAEPEDEKAEPEDEKAESEYKVDLDGKLGKIPDRRDIVIKSKNDAPKRGNRRLNRQKVQNLVELRKEGEIRKSNGPKDYSVVLGDMGLNAASSSRNGELFEGLSRSSVEIAHHFDVLEKVDFPIVLDCVIPLCTSSRPFLFAHIFNLKPLSTPLDLVEKCSLERVISLFENNFSGFFVDVKKVSSKFFSKTFVVKDSKNNLRSSLSFEKGVSFKLAKEGLDNLRDFYLNRMRESVSRSNSIGLVCDGHYPSRSLVNFVRRFGRIYPDKTIVLINIDVVRGVEGALHISSPFASDKLKVVQFIVPDRNVNKWQDIAYCIDAGQKRELKR